MAEKMLPKKLFANVYSDFKRSTIFLIGWDCGLLFAKGAIKIPHEFAVGLARSFLNRTTGMLTYNVIAYNYEIQSREYMTFADQYKQTLVSSVGSTLLSFMLFEKDRSFPRFILKTSVFLAIDSLKFLYTNSTSTKRALRANCPELYRWLCQTFKSIRPENIAQKALNVM